MALLVHGFSRRQMRDGFEGEYRPARSSRDRLRTANGFPIYANAGGRVLYVNATGQWVFQDRVDLAGAACCAKLDGAAAAVPAAALPASCPGPGCAFDGRVGPRATSPSPRRA
jgi:hypothetical protein